MEGGSAYVTLANFSFSKSQQMQKIIVSSLAILICAGLGSVLAWFALQPLQLTGVVSAIATVVLAMVLSVALFAGGIALAKAFKILK